MRIDTISLILSIFVSLFLAFGALIRNHKHSLYQKFALLCVFLMARDLICLVKGTSEDLLRPYLWVTLALGPLSLLLLPHLNSQKRGKVFWEWIYFCFLIFCFGFSISSNASNWMAILQVLAEASLVFPAYLWVQRFANAAAQEPFPREKLRFRYATWGLVGVVALHITDTLYFSSLSQIIPLGTLARAGYLVFLFQLFILREIFTWRELLSRVFLFGSISFILSGIYWLLVSWVDSRPGLFLFNTVIASFAILILFEPLKAGASRLMKIWFFQKRSNLEVELNKLISELRGLDSKDLATKLSTCLTQGLPINTISLYLLHSNEFEYVNVSDGQVKQEELTAGNALIEYISLRRGKAFTLDALYSDQESFYSVQGKQFIQETIDVLKRLRTDLVIPFYLDGKVVGFIAASLMEGSIVSNDLLGALSPLTRQLALQLRNAQFAQVVSEREKLVTLGEMAAGLAHEIKNPLGAIKGASELLSWGQESESQKEYLKIIQDESNRLSRVLTQFLDFAKPRRQEPESFADPLKVIEHVSALCLRENQNIEFHVSSHDSNIRVAFDPEILKQILVNIFLNAIQALEKTSSAKIEIKIKSLKSNVTWSEQLPFVKKIGGWEKSFNRSNRSFVQVTVSDNGPGIPAELIKKVFEPFYTTKGKGTGLGLSICKRLVEAGGGQILIKNNPDGGGIAVVLLLPLYQQSKVLPFPSAEFNLQEGF